MGQQLDTILTVVDAISVGTQCNIKIGLKGNEISRVDRILETIETGLQHSNEVQYYGDTYDYCWRCLKTETVGGRACDKCVAWMSCESDEDPAATDFEFSYTQLPLEYGPASGTGTTNRLSIRDPSDQSVPILDTEYDSYWLAYNETVQVVTREMLLQIYCNLRMEPTRDFNITHITES